MNRPITRSLFRAAHNGETGRTTVTASTPDVDRYGDIVSGPWQLDRFAANPVIAWGHDYSLPPIGKAVDIGLGGEDLVAVIEWDTDDPLGASVARKFDRGFLSSVSVGFYPGESVPRSMLDSDDARHGTRGMVHRQNELLEISAVTIPANPYANKRELEQRGLLEDLTADGLRKACRAMLIELLQGDDAAIKAALAGLNPAAPDALTGWWDGQT